MKILWKLGMRLCGWKIVGPTSDELDKKLYIVMPHTSNWDFLVGISVKISQGMRLNFLAKGSLFVPPVGWVLRGLGGVPVDRSKHNRMVDHIIELYQTRDRFALVITPEGTRSRVTKLKRGFYHIAQGAEVPIVFIAFDYSRKKVTFRPPVYTSGDYVTDMQAILPFYRDKVAKRQALNGISELELLP